MNEQTINTTIKSSIFDRKRELIINPDYIAFEDKDLITAQLTTIKKAEIASFRYGIKWIKGYSFIIGRICCIDIRSNSNEIIKIRIKSVYGINKKAITEKFQQIAAALYDNFFDAVSLHYINQWEEGITIEISGVLFSEAGIQFSSKLSPIKWPDVGTKLYATYYAIFSKSDPDQYKAFEFLHDWNAGVVYSVSRQILLNKGFYSEKG